MYGTDGGSFISSTDGVTWASRATGYTGSNIQAIEFVNGYVIVAGDSTSNYVASTDGTTWTAYSQGTSTGDIRAIIWDGTNYIMNSSSNQNVQYSAGVGGATTLDFAVKLTGPYTSV
jgi:hypothetical protein